MHDAIVIGGGISGLATAHALMLAGLDVQVLERQVRVGGNAITDRFNGFMMEQGPTTFNASMPDAVKQIDRLGLLKTAHDLGEGVKKRYLLNQGKLTGISTNPLGFFMSNYLSPQARFSILFEGLRRRKMDKTEETIHAFATRRFGREFADKVIDPMAAGIFMGDSHQLSIAGAFTKLHELEQKFGSITRGILAAKRGSEPGRHLYSWGGGIASIPAALAKRLGARIHTGVAVNSIGKTSTGFQIKTSAGTRAARAVVLAVQPHVAAGMLENLDPDASIVAGDIIAPPINVVFLGYKQEQVAHPLDGLGFLTTRENGKIISGVQFPSTMYQGRAPDGYVAISAYAGGARNPELAQMPESDLVAQIHAELSDTLQIKGAPVIHRTRRWALGLPQYTIGHRARETVLSSTSERVEGLHLTGNYLNGVSVSNCMETAGQVAGKIIDDLEQPTRQCRASNSG